MTDQTKRVGMPRDMFLLALPPAQARAFKYTDAIPEGQRALVQLAANYLYEVMSQDNMLAVHTSATYKSAVKAFIAVLREVYKLGEVRAEKIRSAVATYGPDDSLEGTTARGVESYVQFVISYPRERITR